MDDGDKKIELMATTVQTLIKSTPKEKGEKSRNREEVDDKTKEEKREMSTPQINP